MTDELTIREIRDASPKVKAVPLPTQLVRFAMNSAELWTDSHSGWATIGRKNHRLDSTEFRYWLVGAFYERSGIVAGDAAVKQALDVLEFNSRATICKTHLRWARAGDVLYCDLGTNKWDAIEVTAGGWRIIPEPPVKFRRTKQTAALPYPVAGSLDELRPFVRCDDNGWLLTKGALFDACKGYAPYFATSVTGEQGSAKSWYCRMLRRLIDPVTLGELSGLPKSEDDLGVLAQYEHVLAFDNVSFLKAEMSDALCRATTGGGIKTRKLYTNGELVVLPIACPIIMNGIPDIATASDLISRSLFVHQPRIPEAERREEKILLGEFEQRWAGIFGAILDHLVAGLRDMNAVTLPSLPRMADSVKWVTACTGSRDFYDAALAEEREAVEMALDCNTVVQLLKPLLATHGGRWEGTAAQLRMELRNLAGEARTIEEKIPESDRGISNTLRREAPSIRKVYGWSLDFQKTNRDGESVRLIKISISPTRDEARDEGDEKVTKQGTQLIHCVPS